MQKLVIMPVCWGLNMDERAYLGGEVWEVTGDSKRVRCLEINIKTIMPVGSHCHLGTVSLQVNAGGGAAGHVSHPSG